MTTLNLWVGLRELDYPWELLEPRLPEGALQAPYGQTILADWPEIQAALGLHLQEFEGPVGILGVGLLVRSSRYDGTPLAATLDGQEAERCFELLDDLQALLDRLGVELPDGVTPSPWLSLQEEESEEGEAEHKP